MTDVLVIGNWWTGPLLAHALSKHGLEATVYSLGERKETEPTHVAAHMGNGEIPETAFLTLGEATAMRVWEISANNLQRAKVWMQELGVPFRERETIWFAASARERELLAASAKRLPHRCTFWESGPLLEQAGHHFEAVLTAPGLELDLEDWRCAAESRYPVQVIDRLIKIDKAPNLDYWVRTETRGQAQEQRFSLVIVATERLEVGAFPSFSDKWIPVTLSSFTWPRTDSTELAVALFNGGADFAVGNESTFRMGSFRNLYEDKSVGVRTEVDPVTLRNVSRFFGGLGWIDPTAPFRSHLSVEAISCDGLPIAGATADLPGVYLVGAFSGRAPNFIFEVAEQLALGISTDRGYGGLSLFSTKRFL